MSDQLPQDQLTGHEYDGISEYDNPIPGWWSWMFVGAIIFSILYYMAYQLGTAGTTVAQEYDNAVTANLLLQFEEIGTLTPSEDEILKYMTQEQWLLFGEKVFEGNCVSCHGKGGVGLVGPNLTDDQYKNVKTLGDIATVIEEGAANGAMPAWKNRLHPNAVVMVSAYVAKLRDEPKPGRPPEGEVIPQWPDTP
tara:strand:+ start:139 stop:720 length:582 start_codon:yes stop_codon:yes gene_type:complete